MKPDSSRKRRDDAKNPGVIMPVPESNKNLPKSYATFLKQVKTRIRQDRLKAQLSANAIQILMYWDLGRDILAKQQEEGWGAKVIDRLSADLCEEFPSMNGFSARNLKDMRKFAECWPKRELVQRTAALIPWRNNQLLLYKLKDAKQRLWYVEQNIQNGWSRDVLAIQIDSQLHSRIGKTANNFISTLPPLDSDLANQVFKDPYLFDFLGTTELQRETELENKLVAHIEKFLLELGQGFAFVGRQVPVEVGGDDFFIDLLFYHLKLRCYVVIELKAGKFKPGHVSQLNMYMNIVDDTLRHPADKSTIGLLLVREKNHTVAKYALAGYHKPIGVAEWEQVILKSFPKELQQSLPSIDEIERELDATETETPTPEKGRGKTSGKILKIIEETPDISIPEIAQKIGVTERSIERNIEKLRNDGLLKRIGPARGGHWRISKGL